MHLDHRQSMSSVEDDSSFLITPASFHLHVVAAADTDGDGDTATARGGDDAEIAEAWTNSSLFRMKGKVRKRPAVRVGVRV